MFHRYVTASSGRRVDYDRAVWLMDRELLRQATEMARADQKSINDPDGFDMFIHRRMWEDMGEVCDTVPLPDEALYEYIWSRYVRLHRRKYHRAFEPDVSLSWE
jgi:hypothetical protein